VRVRSSKPDDGLYADCATSMSFAASIWSGRYVAARRKDSATAGETKPSVSAVFSFFALPSATQMRVMVTEVGVSHESPPRPSRQ
jgi:hypothetical protein